jgi:hypothetical protein
VTSCQNFRKKDDGYILIKDIMFVYTHTHTHTHTHPISENTHYKTYKGTDRSEYNDSG